MLEDDDDDEPDLGSFEYLCVVKQIQMNLHFCREFIQQHLYQQSIKFTIFDSKLPPSYMENHKVQP